MKRFIKERFSVKEVSKHFTHDSKTKQEIPLKLMRK